MRALPLRAKLTAWYSLIMAVSLCVFGVTADLVMKNSIHSTVNEGLDSVLWGSATSSRRKDLTAATLSPMSSTNTPMGRGNEGGCEWLILVGRRSSISWREFLKRPPPGPGRISPYRTRINGERFWILHDTVDVGGTSYDVVVATAMDDFERAIDRFELALYVAVPFFLGVATLGGYWLSLRALAPVDEITLAARDIGSQDLGKRLTVHKTGDELERLAETLNGMLTRLEAAFQRITKFTADASHELRTPVSVMRASAEIALRKSATEDEYREALGQILHESERLSQLIEQLLILARSDSGSAVLPMVRTDLTEPFRNACQQASLRAEQKQLAFFERMPPQPLWVQGDSSSLERLFSVLLDNAVKYTPEGGRIDVQLNSEDGFAVAAIRDTGIGVAPQDVPHVFERFYRADRARSRDLGGSGLGLAIGSWIAQVHGGEIRLKSEPSRGSCFEVRLPLAS